MPRKKINPKSRIGEKYHRLVKINREVIRLLESTNDVNLASRLNAARINLDSCLFLCKEYAAEQNERQLTLV